MKKSKALTKNENIVSILQAVFDLESESLPATIANVEERVSVAYEAVRRHLIFLDEQNVLTSGTSTTTYRKVYKLDGRKRKIKNLLASKDKNKVEKLIESIFG